jgi:hypothetical protein
VVNNEFTLKFILAELYNKICNCRRDYPELKDNLHPDFHLEDCPYRIIVEKQNIKWKKEIPTQES